MHRKTVHFTSLAFAAMAMLGSLGSSDAKAADCAAATVTAVLDIGTAQCGGKVAFETNHDGSQGNRWICTLNDSQGKLVLSAFLSGRSIGYEFVSGGNGCLTATTSPYTRTTKYVIIQ